MAVKKRVDLSTKAPKRLLRGHVNKHAARTEATQEKLIRAAETIFTRDGFANAKLEEIAEHAGYTRGAIYAHYKSKEDLFLALFEQRAKAKIAAFRDLIEAGHEGEDRLKSFRALVLASLCDRSWSILMLEFKLFALRQPKVKARLRRVQIMLFATFGEDFTHLLFGPVKPSAVKGIRRRMALLGSITSAAVLESHFRPELQGDGELEAVLVELLEAVVRV